MMQTSFGPGIAATQARLAALTQSAGKGEIKESLEEAFVELSTTLEELRVADEELRAQNEELERARAGAEAMARKYLELFDLLPAGYLITDPLGVITELNKHAAEMLGRRADFEAGKPLIAHIHQSHVRLFRERLAE